MFMTFREGERLGMLVIMYYYTNKPTPLTVTEYWACTETCRLSCAADLILMMLAVGLTGVFVVLYS